MILQRALNAAVIGLACLTLSACAGSGIAGLDPTCGIDQGTMLPVLMRGAALIVPVRVNGIRLNFMLDTGGALSVIERRPALALGLLHGQSTRLVRDVSGERRVDEVMADTLDVGSFHFPNSKLIVADGLPVDGTIGLDILSHYDLDVDEPHGQMALHASGLCKDERPALPGTVLEMPAIRAINSGAGPNRPPAPFLLVAASVDGKLGLAMFDTGSLGGSVISHRFAAAAGTDGTKLAGDQTQPIRGLGPTTLVSRHQFDQLVVGGEVFERPNLLVASDLGTRFPLVLGADYFRTHRVWFNFAADRIFSVPILPLPAPQS